MTTVALRPPAVPAAAPPYLCDPRARPGELLDPHSVSALHPADASGVTAVVPGDATPFDAFVGATATRVALVEETTDPADTRRRLAEAFAAACAGRGPHGNVPL